MDVAYYRAQFGLYPSVDDPFELVSPQLIVQKLVIASGGGGEEDGFTGSGQSAGEVDPTREFVNRLDDGQVTTVFEPADVACDLGSILTATDDYPCVGADRFREFG